MMSLYRTRLKLTEAVYKAVVKKLRRVSDCDTTAISVDVTGKPVYCSKKGSINIDTNFNQAKNCQ